MVYSQVIVQEIVSNSCDALMKNQPLLLDPEFDINERTITSELSRILQQYFLEYHVNCEYNRMTDEYGIQIPKRIGLNPNDPRVYPDIIVHRQEDGEHNLLILEIKMSWKNRKKEFDHAKLPLYMKELGYQHGLYLELGPGGIVEMKWYTKEIT